MAGLAPDWAVLSRSVRGTQNLARRLGQVLAPGTVLGLVGELGAGKTTLVKGLAEGLGVTEAVVSPTFALMNIYPGARCPLVHIDFYRLDGPDSARALGLEEQVAGPDAVVAIEWADKLPELLGEDCVWIHLEWAGPRARRIAVRGVGKPAGIRLTKA